jgi:hypothetical protein
MLGLMTHSRKRFVAAEGFAVGYIAFVAVYLACAAGCGASVSEYRRHTSECAERAAVIVEREGTSLEQDMEDLAALRAECEAVE